LGIRSPEGLSSAPWPRSDGGFLFGEVPMFYYLLHIPLIHLLAFIVCYARYYGQVHWMFESLTVGQFPITPPPGWGFSLPIVYLF
jgi:hypothetical protein